jgi:hypothetical protein
VVKLLPGTPLAWVRESRAKGKASYRVTEVTEGDRGWWRELLPGTPLAWLRESRAEGKASYRGHGGHRGRSGSVVKLLPGTPMAWVRESRAKGKASHRGHGKVSIFGAGAASVQPRFVPSDDMFGRGSTVAIHADTRHCQGRRLL